MEHSIDFVAALTSEPSLDFVSTLSAEQGCDVCHELHASVYELRCEICEAAICPDCARMRPDTSMACQVCFERRPVRAVPAAPARPSRALVVASVKENASVLRDALLQLAQRVRSGEGLGANLRLALLGALAALRQHFSGRLRSGALPAAARGVYAASSRALTRSARVTFEASRRTGVRARSLSAQLGERSSIVLARSRGNALTASRRATALALALTLRGHQLGMVSARHGAHALRTSGRLLREHGTRLGRAVSRQARRSHALARRGLAHTRTATLQGWTRSSAYAARGLERTRDAALDGWVTLRNLPLRHHASAVLLTLVLLYAVARADQRD